jgi:hypothetical protein
VTGGAAVEIGVVDGLSGRTIGGGARSAEAFHEGLQMRTGTPAVDQQGLVNWNG